MILHNLLHRNLKIKKNMLLKRNYRYILSSFSLSSFILIFSIFISFNTSILGTTTFQSKGMIADNIEKEIEELMRKKSELEALRNKLLNSSIDLSNKDSITNSPKIALVLSGGGAKGSAHVGVLKVLDKYKVPIDIIIGTSIGSIVGGMYSVGYSPDKIEKTIKTLDFSSLLTNGSSVDPNNIQETTLSSKYPLAFDIDKNLKPAFPMGLSNGQQVYLQLKDIFSVASSTSNFDDFPISFRAVSTSLQNGEEVMSRSGDLALEVLKSMAIPTAIEPIKDRDSFYVDGGVTNNFPVDQALKLGADIIIAVDITADSTTITDKSNLVSVINKISTYSGSKNTKRNKSYADILIVPDVKSHSTLDFSNLESLVLEGERSAEIAAPYLMNLTDEGRWEKRKEIYNNFNSKDIVVTNIKLNGGKILNTDTIERLRPGNKNDSISEENLIAWANSIYNLDYVSRVTFTIEGDTIIFNVEEYQDFHINFGVNHASFLGTTLKSSISARNLTKGDNSLILDFSVSEFSDVTLRDSFVFNYKEKDYFSNISLGYNSSPNLIWVDGKNLATHINRNLLGKVGITTKIFNKGYLGLSSAYEYNKNSHYKGSSDFNNFNSKKGYIKNSLLFSYTTLDKEIYPNSGMNIYSELSYSPEKFSSIFAYASYYYPLFNDSTIRLLGGFGKVNGENIPFNQYIKVGGLRHDNKLNSFSFPGYAPMEKQSDEVSFFGIEYRYPLTKSLNTIVKYNYGYLGRDVISGTSDNNHISGYSLGLGLESFLGPIDFTIGNNSENNWLLYQIFIGYQF